MAPVGIDGVNRHVAMKGIAREKRDERAVAVRAWRVTGRATTAIQIWPGFSSGTNSTEPPFKV
jgi:hypothetical protein